MKFIIGLACILLSSATSAQNHIAESLYDGFVTPPNVQNLAYGGIG